MTELRILASRWIVTPRGVVDGGIVIEGERIAAVVARAELPAGLDVEDVGDLAILPGAVDPHVHLNEPGRADWEGFETGTRAAAAGGITTLIDMPLNSRPATVSVEALRQKEAAAAGKLAVDVGFHGGMVPGNLEELEPLFDAGVFAFKAFLAPSGVDEFPAVGARELRPVMEILTRRGAVLMAHAEIESPVATAGDPRAYAAWLAARPDRFETEAHRLLVELVRETGCELHVVHLATSDGIPALREARREGLPVTIETCPHYLTFAAEEIPDADPRFKCAPPMRAARHREGLWQALVAGHLDFVASDHSPAPPDRKTEDLLASWGGIASLQLALPATWTGARKRDLSLRDLARWTATAPARRFGLASRKGSIAPGQDADLVVLDPDATFEVVGAELCHRHPQTAYEGRRLHGIVYRTLVRGRTVYDRSEGFATPGGRVVRRIEPRPR